MPKLLLVLHTLYVFINTRTHTLAYACALRCLTRQQQLFARTALVRQCMAHTDNRKQLFLSAACSGSGSGSGRAQCSAAQRCLAQTTSPPRTTTVLFAFAVDVSVAVGSAGHVSLSMRWAFCAPTYNTLSSTAKYTDRRRETTARPARPESSLSHYTHTHTNTLVLAHCFACTLTHTATGATSCRRCFCFTRALARSLPLLSTASLCLRSVARSSSWLTRCLQRFSA